MGTSINAPTVLVVEDHPQVRGYLEVSLRRMGYGVASAQDGQQALNLLRSSKEEIAVILLDLMLPDCDGTETLEAIRNLAPNLPVIMISGTASTGNVVEAMRSGAADFLQKPVSREQLECALAKALEGRWVAPQAPEQPTSPPPPPSAAWFVGESPRMRELEALFTPIGWSEVPVLIQGETGSGKEVIARELHARSPRAHQPFLKLNCAALPSELVESELFGYERGAFTGAFQKKAGMFEMADGGTILLDEIGDMDVRLQAKLLQVLQDHEFRRLGGKNLMKVNVRLLAATHRDLERAIANGSFREDLYYRLNVMNISLPPLRERREDICGLAGHLLRKHCPADAELPELTIELQHALTAYHWPGNVRELENVMRRYLVLRDPNAIVRELYTKSAKGALRASPLSAPEIPADVAAPEPILDQVSRAKHQAEADAILAALHSTQWNRKRAATLLKIDYKALLYRMRKLNVREDSAARMGTVRFTSRIA
ncbi:MAG TPA: sigma-54 dependent transcriptional regulator [Bryobacteraceae bacterium]|nr:sigma-54 dependent transcriptional regulator [Bryobacteraceae bacterium]